MINQSIIQLINQSINLTNKDAPFVNTLSRLRDHEYNEYVECLHDHAQSINQSTYQSINQSINLTNKDAPFVDTLLRLRDHECNKHVERGRLHVHGRRVREVVVEVLEGASGFVEVRYGIRQT